MTAPWISMIVASAAAALTTLAIRRRIERRARVRAAREARAFLQARGEGALGNALAMHLAGRLGTFPTDWPYE